MPALPAGGSWPLPAAASRPCLFRPALPEWVRPSALAVSDCYWLAYRAHVEYVVGTPGAVAAALAWIAGGEPAPVTGRRDQPVTAELAEAESWATSEHGRGNQSPPARDICDRLGVEYLPIRKAERITAEWSGRVWRTLRWLMYDGVNGRRVEPPIALPARNGDGKVATADELYAAAVAAEPWAYDLMEQKVELRNRVEGAAVRSRQLARIVCETKRDAGVSAA
jgi:hypothetical protein